MDIVDIHSATYTQQLEYTEKATRMMFPLYKKEREQRSIAFPSNSNSAENA